MRRSSVHRMGSPFTAPADQHGYVVPDLDAAIGEWAGKGVGPFLTMRGAAISGYVYEGNASKPKVDVAFGQDGDVQIELIRPVDDASSAYGDFLAAGQSGLHHHGWFCDDFAAAVAEAGREGRTVLQQGSWGGLHFVYYHPAGDDEIIGELIEMTDVNRRIFALIRREAESWDGSRPSRDLLREADWGLRWIAAKAQLRSLFGRS